MPQKQNEYIVYLEEQLTQLENKNKSMNESYAKLQSRYDRIKDRKYDLYQEIQEIKNLNPFKTKEPIETKENKNIENGYKKNLKDEPKNQQEKNRSTGYYRLVKLLEELVNINKQDNKNSMNKIEKYLKGKPDSKKSLFQIKVEVDHSHDHINIELIKPNSSVHEQNEYGKEMENNMAEEKKKELLPHEALPLEQSISIQENEVLEKLVKDIREIKELLMEKETKGKISDPVKNEQLINKQENEIEKESFTKSVTEQKRDITFRDIQNSETVHSFPSKKPKTMTNIRRNLNNNQRSIHSPIHMQRDTEINMEQDRQSKVQPKKK